jgi:hypothetical protein
MRYFGGLTNREVAESLDLTTRTVQRDWGEKRASCLAGCRRTPVSQIDWKRPAPYSPRTRSGRYRSAGRAVPT